MDAACETSTAKRLTSTKGQGQCGSPAQSMGSKPTCPPGWWCEPRPRKVGQGHAPPCRSHRTGIRGKGSRTCWQPCSRARRNQGECTRTRVRSPWCCQEWRWGSKAHPSIPAPAHGHCPCGSSPKNQGSQDCHQHLLQAEHHLHHQTQEARSTTDSSPMPPRLGCQQWSPRQSSWAVGAFGINPKNKNLQPLQTLTPQKLCVREIICIHVWWVAKCFVVLTVAAFIYTKLLIGVFQDYIYLISSGTWSKPAMLSPVENFVDVCCSQTNTTFHFRDTHKNWP